MVAEVDAAHKDGDTLGGVVEVLAYGLPPGLGSHVHWDRRLDAQLAAALMGIQAIKGVEVGDGFGTAAPPRLGRPTTRSSATPTASSARRTGRAGGTEGGMTTGERAAGPRAMKPISTVPRALRHRRRRHRRAGQAHQPALRRLRGAGGRRRRRGDGRARARRRRAGEVRRRLGRRDRAQPRGVPRRDPEPRCARGDGADRPARRAGRAARVGQDHRRPALAERLGVAVPRHRRRRSRPAAGPQHRRHLRRRRRGGTSARSSGPRSRAALAEHDGVLALGGGAVLDRGHPSCCSPATPSSSSTSASPTPPSGSGFDRDRPLLRGNPRAQWMRRC